MQINRAADGPANLVIAENMRAQNVGLKQAIGNNEVADWIKENLMFDQLILEYWAPGAPSSGWVHVSYKKEINSNRKEYLMAIKTDGKTEYKPILGLSTDRYVK